MNWIESIGEVIAYIEDRLTDDLSPEDIAERVFISPAYFQKAFALLCGFTVGEYIRNRRLAEAGNELLSTDARVIDLALKYGYDSPDSFTKAFTRFHGSSPTAVRKNGRTIKSFEPLKIQFLLKGGYIMDYRLEKMDGITVSAKVDAENRRITYRTGKPPEEIPAICWDMYLYDRLCREGLFPEGAENEPVSVYLADTEDTDGFREYEIPAMTWAVFACAGDSIEEARENTWTRIREEWFPQTSYEIVRTYRDTVNVNYASAGDFGEIWVPVRVK